MNSDAIPPKDKTLLDMALEGKSDTFKVKVFEIVRKFRLDATDPSFLLLISTGQLQALLEEFPDAFEALFMRLLEKMQQKYQQMVDGLQAEIKTVKDIAEGVQTTNEELAEDLKTAIEDLRQFSKDHEQATIERVEQIVTLAKAQREALTREVKQREEEERKKRGEAYREALQKSAKTLITEAGAALKSKHVRELILPLVLGALVFTGLGGWVGRTIGQNQLRSEYGYQWAMEHYRVNYRFIQECEKQRRTTCNVNTIAPGVVPGG
ncbi:hypothetical protein H6F67_18485 [Microcoleus sp. FACHB-1515]|uniref:DUF6753 family protein n=1 Tax=Cyanophyceae TaxID=3028117 RepID=UPI001689AD5F|nr:DUF6753 family protein [Microcoleus sp. FACHB-1515]MBD2091834.1 hypothetical protein [Microcoleus sp. FACHB-1515]